MNEVCSCSRTKKPNSFPNLLPAKRLPVSEARVTPEELNARRWPRLNPASRPKPAGWPEQFPIDQAISDLHLDSTTDEIWAEVQAQRAAAAPQPPRTAPPAVAQPLGALRQRLRPAFQAWGQRVESQGRGLRSTWLGILPPLLIGWVLIQTNVIPHFWNSTPAAPPILRHLAQEPDGKTVYADDAALVQISEGKPASQITISENESGNRWPLVKMRGHTYLHGYIASTDKLQPLTGKPLNVYNDDNSGELTGESTSNITLRVDDVPLQKSSGDSDFSGVTVPNFQPDPLTTLSPWH